MLNDDMLREELLREFFEENILGMTAYAISILAGTYGAATKEVAKEVVQSTLTDCWRARHTIKHPKEQKVVQQFLMTSVRRASYAKLRSPELQREVNLEEVEHTISASLDFPGSTEHLDELALRNAVEHMSEPYRTIVVRKYFLGKAFNEIATEMGIDRAHLYKLHATALQRLHMALVVDNPTQNETDESRNENGDELRP